MGWNPTGSQNRGTLIWVTVLLSVSDGYRSQAGAEENWHSPGSRLAVASSLNGCYIVVVNLNPVPASIDEGLFLLWRCDFRMDLV